MLCELLRPGYRTLELSYGISPPDVRIVDRLPILLVPGVSDRGQTIRSHGMHDSLHKLSF
jgi:hypothetical protein